MAEDEGADQEAPVDGAETTADVTEAEADDAETTANVTEKEGDDAAQLDSPDAAEDEAVEDEGEFGEDGVPADDPDFWENYLTDEGFVGVGCFTEFGSAQTYELTQAPDPGTDWLLIVLASDDDGGIFDIISEPQVGEVFSLEDEDGSQATLVAAVLCQAELDMSDTSATSDTDVEEAIDDLNGEGNAVTEEAVSVAGPAVETDMPATTNGNSGLGAMVGLSALLMGAGGVVASRRLASRN